METITSSDGEQQEVYVITSLDPAAQLLNRPERLLPYSDKKQGVSRLLGSVVDIEL